MDKKQLEDLGFVDTSYVEDGDEFTEYTFECADRFTIQVNGVDYVDMFVDGSWVTVPNCKTIEDLKDLIRLFSLPKKQH